MQLNYGATETDEPIEMLLAADLCVPRESCIRCGHLAIQLNDPCAAAVRPQVKLLRPLSSLALINVEIV